MKHTPLIAFIVIAIVLAIGSIALAFIAPVQRTETRAVQMLNGAPAGEMQRVTIGVSADGTRYEPWPLTIKKGVPVELTVDPRIQGCMRDFYAPSLGIVGTAQVGRNVQYFVPLIEGSYPFSCTMNMGKGLIQVVA